MNSSVSFHADESQSFSVFGSELLQDSGEHDEYSLSDRILLTLRRSFMFFIDWILLTSRRSFMFFIGCISLTSTRLFILVIIYFALAYGLMLDSFSSPTASPTTPNAPSYCPPSSQKTSNAPSFYPSLLALKALHDSTDGTNWNNPWNFSSDQSHCNFYGIKCDGCNQTMGMYLSHNVLRGSLPSEIGILSSLSYLMLSYNFITGTIPSEIGMLSSLQRLYLENNSIMGTIPTELCALTSTYIYYDGSEISCTCVNSIYVEGTSCN